MADQPKSVINISFHPLGETTKTAITVLMIHPGIALLRQRCIHNDMILSFLYLLSPFPAGGFALHTLKVFVDCCLCVFLWFFTFLKDRTVEWNARLAELIA